MLIGFNPNQPILFGNSYTSNTLSVALAAEIIIPPASNTNGGTIWQLMFSSGNGTSLAHAAFLTSTVTPGTMIAGNVFCSETKGAIMTGLFIAFGCVYRPFFLKAGLGLFYICSTTETFAYRSALYVLNAPKS